MKVFTAADSPMVCNRLVAMLYGFREIEITGQAQDPLEGIESIQEQSPPPMLVILARYPYSRYRKSYMELGRLFSGQMRQL